MRIAAVIPARNEAARVGDVVRGLTPFGLHRVLVVDDGSSDGTGAAAAAAGAEVLRREGGGKGAALRASIAALRADVFDYYLFLDGDGQHDPADLAGFLARLEAAPRPDILLGSRYGDRARIPRARWAANALGSWILGRIAGVAWRDTQCGFRMVRKAVLERLDLRAEGFAIEMEVIMKAADRRLVWAEVPVRALYQPGWRSQMRGGWDVWAIARFSLRC